MPSRGPLRPFALAVFVLAACTVGPRPIEYGSDACDFCRMTISDPRYGAELVTSKGRVRTFDSIECLGAYYVQAARQGGVKAVLVSDFHRPGTLIPAEQAVFVRTDRQHTPMGMGLVAVAAGADTAALRRELGGPPMTWHDVVAGIGRGGEGEAGARMLDPHGGSR